VKIAIDISPLKDGRLLSHRVRGTGKYIESLQASLLTHHPQNRYQFFARGEKIAVDTDIVHYPYFEPFFLTLPFFKKFKTVVTVHDLTPIVLPDLFPYGTKGALKWEIQKHLLNRSDGIITDSRCSKNDVTRLARISAEKVHVVYLASNGAYGHMSSESTFKAMRKKYSLPQSFFLYVGDATTNKNLPRLVDAAAKTKIPLVMVGKAITEKNVDRTNIWNKDIIYVQYVAEQEKNIYPLGYIPHDDLIAIYNMASAFIMPSLYEGFGLPVLEAMQCGLPVITTNEGSLAEVAGTAAYFVDAYSVESIAAGMKEVFESKELQNKLSKKGIEQAKKFTWQKTVNETIAVYKEIIGYE
jgi:glycosyltransferase involved in cell wall biosynthesis